MTDRLERVRSELEAATTTAARDVRLDLNSIDEGLTEVVGGDKTEASPTHPDRLDELAAKLDGLAAETEGETTAHVEAARDHLVEYRASLDGA